MNFIALRWVLNVSMLFLAALLDQETDDAKFAFEYAVDYVNFQYGTDMLEAEVEIIEPDDEFACAQKLCEILEVSIFMWFRLSQEFVEHKKN